MGCKPEVPHGSGIPANAAADSAAACCLPRAALREGMAEPQALPAEAASKLLMGLNFYGWDYDVNKKGLQVGMQLVA